MMRSELLHKTRDGKVIPVMAMDDEHIFNMLVFLLSELERYKVIYNVQNNPFQAILLGLDQTDVEEMAERIDSILYGRFPIYLQEAFLRGIDLTSVRERLIAVTGRHEKMALSYRKISKIADTDYEDAIFDELPF